MFHSKASNSNLLKMAIYPCDFNNNMFTNEAENKIVPESCCSDKADYSENYESDSEVINDIPGPKNCFGSSQQGKVEGDNLKSVNPVRNVDHKSKPKRRKPHRCSTKTPVFRKSATAVQNTQTSAVDRWEAAQVALAEANSQNILLQRQLQECRLELRTVQRQCKMQSARLNKAIGQEADLPQIVDRMTADIRALQTRLREKTSQHDSSQRRISELQHRIYVLEKEREEHHSQITSDDAAQRRNAIRLDEAVAELQAEKKKTSMLAHQLEVTTRSHKHQNVLAHEQIRQLRRNCRDLENQLHERTQLLQEKIKLLELQNIYSLRIPKTVPSHLPPTENNRGLTPDPQDQKDSASPLIMTKPLLQVRSRTTEPSSQKYSINLGRSRVRHLPSAEVSSRTEPDVDALKVSHSINRKSETLFSLLVDASTCESMVDPCSMNSNPTQSGLSEEPPSIKGAASQYTSQMTDPPASVDPNGFHGDGSATLSTVARDEFSIGSSLGEKLTTQPEEKVRLEEKAVRTEETHAPVTRISADNERVSMIASQNQRPIDVTLATQDPSTSGSSQTTSVLLSKQEEKQEMERKARLLKALQALDQRNPLDETPLIAEVKTDDDDKTPIGTNVQNHADLPDDFTRLTKKRDQELWDELFGSETTVNLQKNTSSVYCGHAGLMAKTVRDDTSRNNDGFHSDAYSPSKNQNRIETSDEHLLCKIFKSPSHFNVQHSSKTSSFLNPPHHRLEGSENSGILEAYDEQEVDSEFEELHV
ncbi:Lebercilin [Fasciola hepatica]|uniref:Lebercilin n=1 Tax=Fasciola hepatica TaxID=6192 RepID=A0A4E0RS50_FASHE|nr:Lebercilin [Fasciola hepatica]